MINIVAIVFVGKAVTGSSGSITQLQKRHPTKTRLGQISPPNFTVPAPPLPHLLLHLRRRFHRLCSSSSLSFFPPALFLNPLCTATLPFPSKSLSSSFPLYTSSPPRLVAEPHSFGSRILCSRDGFAAACVRVVWVACFTLKIGKQMGWRLFVSCVASSTLVIVRRSMRCVVSPSDTSSRTTGLLTELCPRAAHNRCNGKLLSGVCVSIVSFVVN